MKYLAILKDSLREALDSKVLYFTVGLSGLVILCLASVSFQPEPAEKGLETILRSFPGGKGTFGMQRAALEYTIENFEQLNGTVSPSQGEFRFDLVVKEPEPGIFKLFVWFSGLRLDDEGLNAEDREARNRLLKLQQDARNVPRDRLEAFLDERMRQEIEQVTPRQMSRFIEEQLVGRGSLAATQVKLVSSDKETLRFEIEARAKEEASRSWPHTLTFFFGAVPTQWQTGIGPMVYEVENTLVGSIGAGIAMLLSTIITAFFIPNMLRKGTIDLLLAKPIHRSILLIYKFIGGLTFMFVNTVIAVVGLWLVMSLRSGLWGGSFLLVVFVFTFQFAIFYAVSALFGVLTRSPIVSILAACFTWAVLWAAGVGYAFVDATRPFEALPNWVYVTSDTVHFVLPRYKDLDMLTSKLLVRDLLPADSFQAQAVEKTFASIKWGESISFTVGFIAVMLGLASWRFATRDY